MECTKLMTYNQQLQERMLKLKMIQNVEHRQQLKFDPKRKQEKLLQ